jgi:hypothetical protein
MSDLRIEKPVIFISHATTDNPIVDILKTQIERVFANGVQVFASSVPGVIKPGKLWLDEIKSNLEKAKIVIVIITPVSINRPWIWFEVGASWSKMEVGNGRIYPLCVPEIDFKELPVPLSSLQALSLGKAKDVILFFRELCDEFGFGNMKGFKGTTITTRLPKYSSLRVSQSDLNAGALYTGPYEGYSDEELAEILVDNFLYEEYSNFRGNKSPEVAFPELGLGYPIVPPRNTIFAGMLIHYRKLDEKFQLPPNTSKRLLKGLAREFGLVPISDKDYENSVRFAYKAGQDTYRDGT